MIKPQNSQRSSCQGKNFAVDNVNDWSHKCNEATYDTKMGQTRRAVFACEQLLFVLSGSSNQRRRAKWPRSTPSSCRIVTKKSFTSGGYRHLYKCLWVCIRVYLLWGICVLFWQCISVQQNVFGAVHVLSALWIYMVSLLFTFCIFWSVNTACSARQVRWIFLLVFLYDLCNVFIAVSWVVFIYCLNALVFICIVLIVKVQARHRFQSQDVVFIKTRLNKIAFTMQCLRVVPCYANANIPVILSNYGFVQSDTTVSHATLHCFQHVITILCDCLPMFSKSSWDMCWAAVNKMPALLVIVEINETSLKSLKCYSTNISMTWVHWGYCFSL